MSLGLAGVPGLPPGERRYLAELTRRVAARFGADLAGVYLYGSAAAGAYVPGASDLDVAVVVRVRPPGGTLEALVAELAHPGFECPARRLELVVYGSDAVSSAAQPVTFWLNLNTGRDVGLHVATDAAEEPAHWFVIDLAIIRQRAVVLAGAPVEAVFAEQPAPRVWSALEASLDWFAAQEPSSPSRVLNACRAWKFAEEGVWVAKPEAARWAAARGVEGIAAVLRAYERGEPVDPAVAAPVVAAARAALARCRGSG